MESIHVESEKSITEEGYWSAMNVYLNTPNIINKRLWGSKELAKVVAFLPKDETLDVSKKIKFQTLEDFGTEESLLNFVSQFYTFCEESEETTKVEISVLEQLPKMYSRPHAYCLLFTIRDKVEISFIDASPETTDPELIQTCCPLFTYKFYMKDDKLALNIYGENDEKTITWLRTTVMNQIVKWAINVGSVKKGQSQVESLALISNERYYAKYNELKDKYGKEMIKMWPECTDPQKFVYEDVAICTYLLIMWEDERERTQLDCLQTFVDLGCGNGLLVYMLTKEGHVGIGIDVRKRNIWDMYPKDVVLEERTITPSDFNLFPNTDWIIGNHSDELTPWIPVITLRSSFDCKFFLLPCCTYNFDGSKYQRKNSKRSQYTDYLEYMQQLSTECGFTIDVDRLKIPSTKRVCLIGKGRNYPMEQHDEYCNKIHTLINKKKGESKKNENKKLDGNKVQNKNFGNMEGMYRNFGNAEAMHSNWIPDFKARERQERVRNCTQVDKNLIQHIIKEVADYLLSDIYVDGAWDAGKMATLKELAKLFNGTLLKSLKAECGGIKTVLKNNSYMFWVRGGTVQLKYPKTVNEIYATGPNRNVKKRPCWYYNYHPQGCPLMDEDCSFNHVGMDEYDD